MNNVWGEGMINRPEVSIICCTSNYEPFIREALDSILAQRTNFPIEILVDVNDKADHTVAIIEEYAKAYPTMIKSLFKSDDQLSKKKDVQQMSFESARGKYIALCHGHDSWTDEYKLQRQYDYLEKTKHCVLSVHAGRVVHVEEGKEIAMIAPSKVSRFYQTPELIDGDRRFFATSSMFFRSNIVKNRPALFMNVPDTITDYGLILYLSLFGQVHFMRDVMTCSRVARADVITAAMSSNVKNQNFQEVGEWLVQFDEWTNYSYHDVIMAKLQANDFIAVPKDPSETDEMSLQLLSGPNRLKRKVVMLIERNLPQLAGTIKRRRLLMYQLLHRRNHL